ncbi:hypothetical protein ACS0TY_024775 [Phlomoides rotata]
MNFPQPTCVSRIPISVSVDHPGFFPSSPGFFLPPEFTIKFPQPTSVSRIPISASVDLPGFFPSSPGFFLPPEFTINFPQPTGVSRIPISGTGGDATFFFEIVAIHVMLYF